MKRFWKVTMMAIILLLSHAAYSEEWKTVIEDSFKLSPPDRIEGSKLSGFAAEKGSCVWRQHGNDAIFQLSPEGYVTNGNAAGGKAIALLDCIPTGDCKIRLEADLRPGKSQWLALGFSSSDDFFWSKDGQLWLTIRGALETGEGQINIYTKGTSSILKSAKKEDYGFTPDKPSHVEIIYDQPANTVSVTVNDRKLIEGYQLNDFKPAIRTAGIMTNFPEANGMQVGNFKVSLQGGELQAPAANVARDGKPLIIIDSTAVKATNLFWGASRDLQIENSLEPSIPYFASFEFGLKPQDAGEYNCWALVFGCGDVPYLSSWSWSLDKEPDQEGKALEGSLAGMPRWVKFGTVKLAEGKHSLRINVTKRRSFPDDAYLFHLYKVIFAPADVKFSPAEANVELGFNPQGNMQGNASAQKSGSTVQEQQQGRVILYKSGIADPVSLTVDYKNVLPPVQPIWRDFSEGGIETGGDFLMPQLVKPLRPRFIRKCHVLSLAKITRGVEGKLVYDFTESLAVVKAIRAVGAEPIIDLANPPGVICKDAQGKAQPVKDWATNEKFQKEWYEVVMAFLTSLKEANLSVKYFTSFNEPEFSGMGTRGNNPTSLMINRVAAQAVKDFDKNLQMGGMEFGNSRSEIYNAFLDYIGKNPENIDFFSYHQYQSTPERHADEIKYLRKELDKRSLQRVKIAVDEWQVASSGEIYHRTGVRAATYSASCMKAMAEAGLDIGGSFDFRDFPKEGWQWGMITKDGFLKPQYWGQWLWSQLPDGNDRLAVTGEDDRIQSFAFRDGEGIAMLVWYDAPENYPNRKVSISISSGKWAGSTVKQWQLDSMRHIGYIPEGAPVELPYSVKSEKFKDVRMPSFSFKMLPASMQLIKMQPLAADQEPVKPRPILLDNEGLSTGKLRDLRP